MLQEQLHNVLAAVRAGSESARQDHARLQGDLAGLRQELREVKAEQASLRHEIFSRHESQSTWSSLSGDQGKMMEHLSKIQEEVRKARFA